MDLESPKAKAGGLAFEVILKPANTDTPPAILAGSPPKEKSITQELIEKKLKEAEERRLSMEASRLQPILKDKERAQDANQRIQELNSSFSKETEKKLAEKMEAQEEKKRAQIKAIQDRLNQHNQHVVEAPTKFSRATEEKLTQKMEASEKKREEQLRQQLEKLKTHESRVAKVRLNKLNLSVSEEKENSGSPPEDVPTQ